MAHKKGVGSSRNGRESHSKRLGVKIFGGSFATAGNIIVRQRGTRHYPGVNVGMGKDHTLYALTDGMVFFKKKTGNKSYVNIEPIVEVVPEVPVVGTTSKSVAEAKSPQATITDTDTAVLEKEAPVEKETKEKIKAEKKAPAKKEVKAEKKAPAKKEAKAEKKAPAKKEVTAEKKAPAKKEAKAEKKAPAKKAKTKDTPAAEKKGEKAAAKKPAAEKKKAPAKKASSKKGDSETEKE